jgi:hypothetical protein
MKSLLGLLSCVVLILSAAHLWGLHRPQEAVGVTTNAGVRVPVVLELFTSEGCSSCPPADTLLARLEEQQPIGGAEIIALEEHVDYWDHQGWVDPFSSFQWTQRQQGYASGFGDQSIYTPELVIDGRFGFVGSRAGEAYRVITGVIAQPRATVSLTLLRSDIDHERLKVEVGKLERAQHGDVAEVWLAITEKALHSAVSSGENSGHDLHHAPVVRSLHKVGTADVNAAPAFAGESDLKLDSAWKRTNLRVVAFVQEKRSHHILGAASAVLGP